LSGNVNYSIKCPECELHSVSTTFFLERRRSSKYNIEAFSVDDVPSERNITLESHCEHRNHCPTCNKTDRKIDQLASATKGAECYKKLEDRKLRCENGEYVKDLCGEV
jgi:hypothetical protein